MYKKRKTERKSQGERRKSHAFAIGDFSGKTLLQHFVAACAQLLRNNYIKRILVLDFFNNIEENLTFCCLRHWIFASA